MSKMLNNYIQCEDTEGLKTTTESGFETPKEVRFKILTVINSNEDDILIGDKVKVPINSGTEDITGDNLVIIKRTDIVEVL